MGSWDATSLDWASATTGGTDGAWVSGANAVFTGTGGIAANTVINVTLNSPLTVGSISITTLDYNFVVSAGDPLTITGGINATYSGQREAATFNGTGGVVLSGDQTINVGTGAGLDINTVLSGSDVLTKAGVGSLALSGKNTFTGKFDVTGGLLGINSDAALGADPSTFQADNITLDGGGLAVGVNFTTDVNFSAGGSVSLNANRGITLGAGGGTFRVGFGSSTVLAVVGDVLTVNGVISGSGALSKIDSGALVLAADNTYTGATNITGILQVGTGGTTGTISAGTITIGTGNGNALNFDRSDNVTVANTIVLGGRLNMGAAAGETVTLTGAMSGTGELWVNGLGGETGTIEVDANAGSNRASSNVIVAGTLQTSDLTRNTSSALGSGSIFLGQSTTPATGAGLRYTGASVSTDAIANVQTPFAFIDVANASTVLTTTSTIKGEVAADLITKLGVGTWDVAGATDNTRLRVQVNAGTLLLDKVSTTGIHAVAGTDALILNSGTVQITGSGGDQIYDPSTVDINGGTFDMNGQNESFDGLNSTSANGVITNTASGSASVLTLGVNNGSSAYSGKMQDGAGTLGLVKSGSGSLTLSGTSVLTGGVNITKGRLIVTGSVTGGTGIQVTSGLLGGTGTVGPISTFVGAIVSPGATATGAGIGTLTSGSLDLSQGGTFAATIDTTNLLSSMETIIGPGGRTGKDGNLSLGISAAQFTLTDVGGGVADPINTKFTLMSYTGDYDGGTFSFLGQASIDPADPFTFGANVFTIDYSATGADPNDKYVVLTVVGNVAVPEPASSGLLLGGMALLGCWRPRRKATRLTKKSHSPSR